MIGRSFLAAAFLVAFTAPALAFHCPADVKAIDAGLSKSNLSSAKATEIKKLRDQGQSQHKAGQHKEAVDTLAKAMRMVLNDM